MTLTTNQKERVQYLAALIPEGFKVLVACLLLVFIPQHCPETGQTCTFQENFTDLNDANSAILALNFFTLVLFMYLYYLESARQFFFIKELDTDKTQADNNLSVELKNHPNLLQSVINYNQKYYNCIRFTFFTFVLNVILSTFVIVYYFYDGFRTVTSLITNVLLIVNKLWGDWSIVSECLTSDCIALSTALQEPVSYNTIDKKRKASIIDAKIEINSIVITEEKKEN